MNKVELIEAIAESAGLSKKDAERAVKAFVETIGEEVCKGGKVQLPGFGTFELSTRAARTGRNPQTGAEIQIPAVKVPKFKPAKAFKDEANAR